MRYPTVLLLVAKATIASPFLAAVEIPRHVPDRWSPEFWYRILVSVMLVLAGGVFAGYVVLGVPLKYLIQTVSV
jgi:metal transporter CNNM